MKPKILIVDDEAGICVSLKYGLSKDYDVVSVMSARAALEEMDKRDYQLVLLDMFLGRDDGLALLQEIKLRNPQTIVIVMTAHGSIRSSVDAMKKGAFTYITKPLDLEELNIFIQQGLNYRTLNEKVAYLSEELQDRYQYGGMIGKSPAMVQVYDLVERLKMLDTSVLITGESGTGKELVARAIHFMGERKDESFIEVNCAAIPESLLEMEFFGYKRGAFTGAIVDKKGKFEAADKGTLFFDEIGDMPMSLQGKLLRVLQEKHFTPLGSNESRSVDVRVVAATNRDLWQMVQDGTFRQDLYYRLNVVNINLPPLRERKQDVPLLISHFLTQINREQGRDIRGATREVERILLTYDYPGNVRELKNIVEFAAIMCTGDHVQPEDLPQWLLKAVGTAQESHFVPADEPKTLYEIEKRAILEVLYKNGENQSRTATELGISRSGLLVKLKEYGYQKK
ncbi:MAG: sigma-54-dependent Fis family transcriptional regulator [Ruminococcaceae bacterium]|nr:sigma-54-dependent Fis family transcriptional regulator [Oscillospiraceae bacterium]